MKTIGALLVAVLLAGVLGLPIHAGTMRAVENLRGETVLLPPSTPDREQLLMVSFFKITAETEIIAALAVYDDPQTGTRADYVELYDSKGDLLSVSWVDRFGILRTAMDYGLLKQEASGLEGILVLLQDGIPV